MASRVAGGVIEQPLSAALTAAMISSTVTLPFPSTSHGGQACSLATLSAIFTHRTNSSIVTDISWLQSPGQGVGVGVAAGVGVAVPSGGGTLVTTNVSTSDAVYTGESVVRLYEILKLPNCPPGTTICHDG